jgi:hypothetical protein
MTTSARDIEAAAALLSLMATERPPDELFSDGVSIEESVHAHTIHILKKKEHAESRRIERN